MCIRDSINAEYMGTDLYVKSCLKMQTSYESSYASFAKKSGLLLEIINQELEKNPNHFKMIGESFADTPILQTNNNWPKASLAKLLLQGVEDLLPKKQIHPGSDHETPSSQTVEAIVCDLDKGLISPSFNTFETPRIQGSEQNTHLEGEQLIDGKDVLPDPMEKLNQNFDNKKVIKLIHEQKGKSAIFDCNNEQSKEKADEEKKSLIIEVEVKSETDIEESFFNRKLRPTETGSFANSVSQSCFSIDVNKLNQKVSQSKHSFGSIAPLPKEVLKADFETKVTSLSSREGSRTSGQTCFETPRVKFKDFHSRSKKAKSMNKRISQRPYPSNGRSKSQNPAVAKRELKLRKQKQEELPRKEQLQWTPARKLKQLTPQSKSSCKNLLPPSHYFELARNKVWDGIELIDREIEVQSTGSQVFRPFQASIFLKKASAKLECQISLKSGAEEKASEVSPLSTRREKNSRESCETLEKLLRVSQIDLKNLQESDKSIGNFHLPFHKDVDCQASKTECCLLSPVSYREKKLGKNRTLQTPRALPETKVIKINLRELRGSQSYVQGRCNSVITQ
eukprot:TRINITY_DN10887_c0_g1_i1.p1 TRINITY_DN10887_c0_g1~~TRINITY_DN10887_c0_g1_i1.p1  ORF type:complete len:565 (-),score=75.09 TRINITY_DN10887_c0_g1_i1:126-1820(-)